MHPNTIVYLLILGCFLFLVLFCFFVKVRMWMRAATGILAVVVTIFIIIGIGHTEWNRLSQLEANLNQVGTGKLTVNNLSSQEALKELTEAPKPFKLTVKESRTEPIMIGEAYWNRIEVNGKEYKVKDICYTGPLNWTPFQKWTVLELQQGTLHDLPD
ncbi:hypothetical protein P4H65_12060 [Paenibacillus chitinolyticus]|uniref:hypothetical protein n=1 Tax=Paenibacillus chitinolyticus TaxID=79263 RepID=UPI002DB889F8|nr:hypothetical protein [Paenibacillus chitinolyticus]MEC0246522.1 hypothetical protein [Paenibacillus chitinolyticus]